MSDYEDGKNVLRRRPEPGRMPSAPKAEPVVEKEAKVDVDAIANAVVKAIGDKMPVVMHGGGSTGSKVEDGFDNAKTLERLADSMSVHGADSESNFDGEGLGKVKMTKKDGKDVQSTIDILSDMD
jgi:hypothetical protein